jgi:oligopeptide transport system ATP-binding protein
MVKHISNRVGVMYLGNLVEMAESSELYKNPVHPYTKALLSAIPVPDPDEAAAKKRIVLEGDVPSPIDPPKGCKFKGRCAFAKDICSQVDPVLKDVGGGHFAACHLLYERTLELKNSLALSTRISSITSLIYF